MSDTPTPWVIETQPVEPEHPTQGVPATEARTDPHAAILTRREYEVRYPDGSWASFDSEDRARRAIERGRLAGKVYTRTITSTVTATAWAEVIR